MESLQTVNNRHQIHEAMPLDVAEWLVPQDRACDALRSNSVASLRRVVLSFRLPFRNPKPLVDCRLNESHTPDRVGCDPTTRELLAPFLRRHLHRAAALRVPTN